MPSEDSPAVLVARFLQTNDYRETLETFLAEARLPPDAGVTNSKNDLTIEKVLDEKKTFDLSRDFEKVGLEEANKGWSLPAPSEPTTLDEVSNSNILHASIDKVYDYGTGEPLPEDVIIATGADRTLNILEASPAVNYRPHYTSTQPADSPTLSCAMIDKTAYMVTGSMSGALYLHDLLESKCTDERRDHTKYIVKIAVISRGESNWIASAGWDGKVFLYHIKKSAMLDCSNPAKLGQPIGVIDLPSNPESIVFIDHPEISTPVLLVSRRDSTFIYYYGIPDVDLSASDSSSKTAMTLLGKQNLAPHSNAWIAFTPSALAISPTDPSLLAVATSSVPHMKLIIVRLLLPPPPSSNLPPVAADTQYQVATGPQPTQASQARAALVIQDRESAAILVQCTTLAPQTTYSTPGLAWRPDGTGVWVNGDDGALRGIETTTGKIICTLKGGHDPGFKVRCIWAGVAEFDRSGDDVEGDLVKEEWIVSGGFDRRLVVWRCAGT